MDEIEKLDSALQGLERLAILERHQAKSNKIARSSEAAFVVAVVFLFVDYRIYFVLAGISLSMIVYATFRVNRNIRELNKMLEAIRKR